MTSKHGGRLVRLYSMLLHALPRDFKRRNRDELTRLAGELIGEAERSAGWRSALACFSREAADILKTAARLHFGPGRRRANPPLIEIEGDGTMAMDSMVRDVRLAGRTLRRNPGFAVAVILTLAVGVGATTAIFSVVNQALIRPLPFQDPDRLTMLWQTDRLTGTQREASSVPDYFDLRQRSRSFAELAAYAQNQLNLTGTSGDPRRVKVARVTAGMAKTLGVEPARGRMFSDGEDTPGGPQVVLLSDSFWRGAFGADPSVIGRSISLNDEPYTVIGTLPPGLDFPDRDTDLWAPLQQGPDSSPRSLHWVTVVGRLNPQASLQEAQSEMTAVAAQLEKEHSENRARGAFVEPFDEVFRGSYRPALLALLAAVLTLFLMTCVNVAGLQLARGAGRARELAVQAALGAGTGRLLQRFFVEGLIVAGVASVLGLALAALTLWAIGGLAPAEVRHLGSLRLDMNVFLFGLGLSAAVAVSFGLVPVLQARRVNLNAALQNGRGEAAGGLRGPRIRRLLVVTQLAMALSLLVGAGLLVTSLQKLQGVDPGFLPENVLRIDFQLPASRYPREFPKWPRWPEVHNFNRELLSSVRAMPDVSSAALTTNHPLEEGFTNSFVIVGREAEAANQGELKTRLVSEGYFKTNGVRLLEGRVFTPRDSTDSPRVLLLNEAAVRRYFPDGGVLGARIRFWGDEREVVGLVASEKMHGLREAAPPAMYVPMAQAPPFGVITLMVRTSKDPKPLLAPVRAAVWAIDPELAVFNALTMEETLLESLSRERFLSLLLTLFAGLAVMLAVLGVHGVLSHTVAQRRREIGVRMALGAQTGMILRLVTGQGLKLAVAGVAIGLGLALAAAPLLSSLLYGVDWTDPFTFTAGSAALLASALLASALPAWKATRIDPATALRTE